MRLKFFEEDCYLFAGSAEVFPQPVLLLDGLLAEIVASASGNKDRRVVYGGQCAHEDFSIEDSDATALLEASKARAQRNVRPTRGEYSKLGPSVRGKPVHLGSPECFDAWALKNSNFVDDAGYIDLGIRFRAADILEEAYGEVSVAHGLEILRTSRKEGEAAIFGACDPDVVRICGHASWNSGLYPFLLIRAGLLVVLRHGHSLLFLSGWRRGAKINYLWLNGRWRLSSGASLGQLQRASARRVFPSRRCCRLFGESIGEIRGRRSAQEGSLVRIGKDDLDEARETSHPGHHLVRVTRWHLEVEDQRDPDADVDKVNASPASIV